MRTPEGLGPAHPTPSRNKDIAAISRPLPQTWLKTAHDPTRMPHHYIQLLQRTIGNHNLCQLMSERPEEPRDANAQRTLQRVISQPLSPEPISTKEAVLELCGNPDLSTIPKEKKARLQLLCTFAQALPTFKLSDVRHYYENATFKPVSHARYPTDDITAELRRPLETAPNPAESTMPNTFQYQLITYYELCQSPQIENTTSKLFSSSKHSHPGDLLAFVNRMPQFIGLIRAQQLPVTQTTDEPEAAFKKLLTQDNRPYHAEVAANQNNDHMIQICRTHIDAIRNQVIKQTETSPATTAIITKTVVVGRSLYHPCDACTIHLSNLFSKICEQIKYEVSAQAAAPLPGSQQPSLDFSDSYTQLCRILSWKSYSHIERTAQNPLNMQSPQVFIEPPLEIPATVAYNKAAEIAGKTDANATQLSEAWTNARRSQANYLEFGFRAPEHLRELTKALQDRVRRMRAGL